jgi:hypothetical protein
MDELHAFLSFFSIFAFVATFHFMFVLGQAFDRSDFFDRIPDPDPFSKIGSDSAFRSTCTFWIADPIRSDLPIYKVVLLGGTIFSLLFLGLLILLESLKKQFM